MAIMNPIDPTSIAGQIMGQFGAQADRRHAKEQQQAGSMDASLGREFAAGEGSYNRAHEAQLQNAMLGFQGHEGAANRGQGRYMNDSNLLAQYGPAYMEANKEHFGDDSGYAQVTLGRTSLRTLSLKSRERIPI